MSDEEKIKFLPLYLEGSSITFFESNLSNDIQFADLENILESDFKQTVQNYMLNIQIYCGGGLF